VHSITGRFSLCFAASWEKCRAYLEQRACGEFGGISIKNLQADLD